MLHNIALITIIIIFELRKRKQYDDLKTNIMASQVLFLGRTVFTKEYNI